MSSSTPVRSVVRAIEMLQALNRQPVSTIEWLHAQTRIPKPTIVRLLQTLEGLGLVRHAPQHGAYYLASGVRSLCAGYHSEPMIVEASAPVLDALTVRIKWPTAVAVLEDNAMVVRYSTIPLSPLALKHSTLNVRLSLVSRAIGRVYLAFCAPDVQDAILLALTQSQYPEDAAACDTAAVRRVLDGVRAAGYALREPGIWPASNTLAVPVHGEGGVAASIGVTFFSSALTPAAAVERFLPDMQEAARDIGERLKMN
ncbi:MAG: DNA-binding transcriptional regulator [Hydrogenophaga sp.]|nr:DNA-binding transcriptional regulator [Hydrogenophaga sp.]MDZ4356730.1 DNA-binding transcriptional regulator [Variovorax sp.]